MQLLYAPNARIIWPSIRRLGWPARARTFLGGFCVSRGMGNDQLVAVGAAHVHAPDHFRVAGQEGFRVGAIFDRDRSRRACFAERLGAEPLERLEAIAEVGATAAFVFSETGHHEEDVIAALEAGFPTFVEKPLASSSGAARRMAETAEQRGLLLDTAFFLRTNPAMSGLRDRVKGGALGQVLEARIRFSHDGALADWLDLTSWMTVPELAGYGGFADEGVHALDWLLWTLGPVSSGAARFGHTLGFSVDDHGAATLALASGGTAVIEAGWTDTTMRLEIDLVGTEGGADLKRGVARQWRRGETEASWTERLRPLDAGEGARPFLRSVRAGDGRGLVPPAESVAACALLDLLYGTSETPWVAEAAGSPERRSR